MNMTLQRDYFLNYKNDYKRLEYKLIKGSKFYFDRFYCFRVDYEDYYRCMKNCALWEDIRKTEKYFVLKVSGKKVDRLIHLLKWDYTITEWIER